MTEKYFELEEGVFTPYNVGSVLRRLFSTAGGKHDSISTAGGGISTAEAGQYCGGIASVLRRLFSTPQY